MNLFKSMITVSALFLCACGGGGGGGTGGGGGGGTEGAGAAQPTSAVLHLSTVYNGTGTAPSGEPITGVQVTVNLPPGVNLKDNGITTSTATAGKTATPIIGDNIRSTATVGGRVTFYFITNPPGFASGEFALFDCTVATGAFPKATDFSLSNTSVAGATTFDTLPFTVTFAADIK